MKLDKTYVNKCGVGKSSLVKLKSKGRSVVNDVVRQRMRRRGKSANRWTYVLRPLDTGALPPDGQGDKVQCRERISMAKGF